VGAEQRQVGDVRDVKDKALGAVGHRLWLLLLLLLRLLLWLLLLLRLLLWLLLLLLLLSSLR
jgi:hypothetical protein